MRLRLVLAAVVLALAGTSGLAHANGFTYDHLKCFRIRDSLVDRRTILLADLFPEAPFSDRLDCRLRLPALHFCVPVAKENVQAEEDIELLPFTGQPATDYLCYDVRCERERLNLDVLDQFGVHAIRTKRSDFLCMPARKITDGTPVPTATPVPTQTPVPSPTPPPNPCRLILDQAGFTTGNETCGGDCPPSTECLYVGQGGRPVDECACVPTEQACSVRPTSTGLSGDANCGGFCPAPGQTCIFDVQNASGGPGPCGCVDF